jgi:hypothetical protein
MSVRLTPSEVSIFRPPRNDLNLLDLILVNGLCGVLLLPLVQAVVVPARSVGLGHARDSLHRPATPEVICVTCEPVVRGVLTLCCELGLGVRPMTNVDDELALHLVEELDLDDAGLPSDDVLTERLFANVGAVFESLLSVFGLKL